jgi:hypothetical protein
MGNTHEVPKLALVMLASNTILELLGMIAWGVRSLPLDVQTEMERNEDLAIVIQKT